MQHLISNVGVKSILMILFSNVAVGHMEMKESYEIDTSRIRTMIEMGYREKLLYQYNTMIEMGYREKLLYQYNTFLNKNQVYWYTFNKISTAS